MNRNEIARELIKEASRLRQEAEKLEQAAELLTSKVVEYQKPVIEKNQTVLPKFEAIITGRETRLKQLVNFLKENGPDTRREILLKTDLPKGTVSHLLGTMKDVFEIKEGKWHVKNKE